MSPFPPHGLSRRTAALWLTLAAVGAGCGDDAGGDDAGPVAPEPEGPCPPSEPVGLAVGDVVPNLTLPTCAGDSRALWELCPQKAALVYSFAPWCDSCQLYAASGVPTDLYERYAAEGFDLWFVVTSNAEGDPPDGADCEAVSTEFALPFPVLFDPDGATAETLGMPQNSAELVLTEGAIIHSKTNGAPEAVTATLQAIFGF